MVAIVQTVRLDGCETQGLDGAALFIETLPMELRLSLDHSMPRFEAVQRRRQQLEPLLKLFQSRAGPQEALWEYFVRGKLQPLCQEAERKNVFKDAALTNPHVRVGMLLGLLATEKPITDAELMARALEATARMPEWEREIRQADKAGESRVWEYEPSFHDMALALGAADWRERVQELQRRALVCEAREKRRAAMQARGETCVPRYRPSSLFERDGFAPELMDGDPFPILNLESSRNSRKRSLFDHHDDHDHHDERRFF